MKKKSTTLLFLFISILGISQDFEWVYGYGSAVWDEGMSVTVDNLGNVYTVGQHYYTVDFDPGPDTFNLTSAGSYDIFIQKLDTAGNLLWAKSVGGSDFDLA
jgi:hypothetical protein